MILYILNSLHVVSCNYLNKIAALVKTSAAFLVPNTWKENFIKEIFYNLQVTFGDCQDHSRAI